MKHTFSIAALFLMMTTPGLAAGNDPQAAAGPAPLYVGLLIQDNLPNVTTDTKAYREFIRALPKGTHVAIAYARPGAVEIAVPFTDDLEAAADSMRAPAGFARMAPGSPFISAKEFLNKFPGDPSGSRHLVFVSDGIDSNYGDFGSPFSGNPYLTSAVSTAKKLGIEVDTIFAPSSLNRGMLGISVGQGTLNYLSQNTGGVAYYSGSTYVSAQPFLERILEKLNP